MSHIQGFPSAGFPPATLGQSFNPGFAMHDRLSHNPFGVQAQVNPGLPVSSASAMNYSGSINSGLHPLNNNVGMNSARIGQLGAPGHMGHMGGAMLGGLPGSDSDKGKHGAAPLGGSSSTPILAASLASSSIGE